ncbi:unnamed protein product [Calypogeia fissa]
MASSICSLSIAAPVRSLGAVSGEFAGAQSLRQCPSSSTSTSAATAAATPLLVQPWRRISVLSSSRRGGIRAAATAEADSEVATKPLPRLKRLYLEKVVPALKEEFKYKNDMEVPYVKKVVVNCGVGAAAQNAKALESTVRDLSLVTGQKPITTRAKKAIAGFKLREGVPVGVCITLRGEVMYSFLDRLVNLALPRTRDFQGVNQYSFDGKGNYTLGLPEQSVFPEIRFENIDKERGMDVSIVNTARNDTEGQKLLALLGMPFKEGGGRSASSGKKSAKDAYKGRGRNRR